jgi:hypothetical protein
MNHLPTVELSGCRLTSRNIEEIDNGSGDFWMARWNTPGMPGEVRFSGVWLKQKWAVCHVIAFKDVAGVVPKFAIGPPGFAEAFVKKFGGKVGGKDDA